MKVFPWLKKLSEFGVRVQAWIKQLIVLVLFQDFIDTVHNALQWLFQVHSMAVSSRKLTCSLSKRCERVAKSVSRGSILWKCQWCLKIWLCGRIIRKTDRADTKSIVVFHTNVQKAGVSVKIFVSVSYYIRVFVVLVLQNISRVCRRKSLTAQTGLLQ